MEVMLTISGSPRWANGGRNPNAMPQTTRRFHRLRTGDRHALLRALRWLPVRSLLLGLERAEPQPLPDPPVQRRR